MVNTISVRSDILEDILATLKDLKREVSVVKEKLEEAPPYGSKEWWQWSIKKSEEDFEAGRYTSFDTPKKLQKYLDSLK